MISHLFLNKLTLIPNFLRHLIALSTSSDINKLYAVDLPNACEASKAHLIDKLLSPFTWIVLLNGLIFFFITIGLAILTQSK